MQSFIQAKQSRLDKEDDFHPVIKWAARIISVVFHPLFIPVYLILFYIHISPAAPFLDSWQKLRLSLSATIMYTVFPLVTILLAKALGFVKSIFLRSQKDRIIPYISCGLYYFWMWYVLRNQPEFPRELVLLSFAIFVASSGGLIANSFFKISMHSIAAGVMCTFIYLLAVRTDANYGFYISLALLFSGLVCTCRLINSDHDQREVYAGFFLGMVAQLFAYWVVF